MLRLYGIVCGFLCCIVSMWAAPKEDSPELQIKNDKNCAPIASCRADICIYACDVDNIGFNRYIMESHNLEQAYATWLMLTQIEGLLPELPKEAHAYMQDSLTITYTWKNAQTLAITFHEKEVLVGELTLAQVGKLIVIDDKLHCVGNL